LSANLTAPSIIRVLAGPIVVGGNSTGNGTCGPHNHPTSDIINLDNILTGLVADIAGLENKTQYGNYTRAGILHPTGNITVDSQGRIDCNITSGGGGNIPSGTYQPALANMVYESGRVLSGLSTTHSTAGEFNNSTVGTNLVTLFQGVYSNNEFQATVSPRTAVSTPAINNQWHAGAYGASTTTGNMTSAAYVRTSRSIAGLYTQCGTLSAAGAYPTACVTLSNNEFQATVSPRTAVNTEGTRKLVYVPSYSLFGLTGQAMQNVDQVASSNGTCSVYLSGNATHYYHGRFLGKSAGDQYLQPIQDGNSILVRSESDTRYQPILDLTKTGSNIPIAYANQTAITGDVANLPTGVIVYSGRGQTGDVSAYHMSAGYKESGYVLQGSVDAYADPVAFTAGAALTGYQYDITGPRRPICKVDADASAKNILTTVWAEDHSHQSVMTQGETTFNWQVPGVPVPGTQYQGMSYSGADGQRPSFKLGSATFDDFRPNVFGHVANFNVSDTNAVHLYEGTAAATATLQAMQNDSVVYVYIVHTGTLTLHGGTAGQPLELIGSTTLTKKGVGRGWKLTKIRNSPGKFTFLAVDVDADQLPKPSTATANQVLTYNGTTWIAANAPASGGGGLTQATADTLYQPKLGNATYTKVTVPALSSGVNAFSGDSYLDVTGALGSGGKKTTYLNGVTHHGSAPDVPYGTVVGEYQTDPANGTLGAYGLLKTDYREIGLYSKGDGVSRVTYLSARKDTITLAAGTDGDSSSISLTATGGALYTPPATLTTLTNALSMLNMGQMDTRYLSKPATATANQILTYNGTAWNAANAPAGGATMPAGTITGELLTFNGSVWVGTGRAFTTLSADDTTTQYTNRAGQGYLCDDSGLQRVGTLDPARYVDATFLTLGDCNARYAQLPAGQTPWTGEFPTNDGRTVRVQNGIIYDVGL